jgi:hypothetical protein
VSACILTVLRSGGEYDWSHVERLRRQCERFGNGARFHCLHDDLMLHDWPGWWPKIEMLRLRGPILYMDLDTSVVGDLTPLLDAAERHRFIALRNPLPTPSRFGSGLMAWSDDMSHVYDRFARAPEHHMRRCTTPQVWGDQGFIAEDEPDPVLWQDLFPDQILSWKVDCKQGVPESARVVYFHGTPKPWQIGM